MIVELPWTRPPQSLNDRQHHHVKAKATAQALAEARIAVRASKLPKLAGANLTLHYQIADRRRRDATNLASVLKVVEDALVLEDVLLDDSWVSVPQTAQTIHPPIDGNPAAMWLEIEPLGERP